MAYALSIVLTAVMADEWRKVKAECMDAFVRACEHTHACMHACRMNGMPSVMVEHCGISLRAESVLGLWCALVRPAIFGALVPFVTRAVSASSGLKIRPTVGRQGWFVGRLGGNFVG